MSSTNLCHPERSATGAQSRDRGDAGGRENVKSDFPILQTTTSRGKRLVYLDSAATSQKPQVVIDSLVQYYQEYNANIHRGVYEIAARATDAFEEARAKVAGFIGAETSELIWTRNTTEAINLVAYSWGLTNLKPGDVILTSQLEHHSNLVPWQLLAEKTGAILRFIPVDQSGLHVLDDLDTLLDGTKLLAISHVSNTLGIIAPLEHIIPRARAAGATILIDGAQAAPHLPVDVKALDADFYAISGHKMLAPTGIGALYGKRELLDAMPPFLAGGDMIRKVEYTHTSFNELPWKFEAGTSNVADAIGFGVAVDYLKNTGMDWIRAHEQSLLRYALLKLAPLEKRGLVIYGPKDPERISGVLSLNLGDVHAHDVASILDTEGVCIRAGHHCTMPLMEKMGWPATARASFYLYNDESDIDALADALEKARKIFKLLSMDDFYRDYILDHYRNPRNFGTLEHPDATAEDLNPLCGDQIRVDLKIDIEGNVTDVRFSGKGCAISQASASMLTESIKGMKLEEVARLSKEAVLDNVGIGISPTRMKCAMLGLRVLKSAAIGELATWPDED